MGSIFNKKETLLRLSILAIGILSMLVFTNFSEKLNKTIKSAFQNTAPNQTTDTNIVIIKITQADIEKLGSWPLKRSYYALLINSLSKFEPKMIGLEIFLSGNTPFQSTYDELMYEEISKANNVVLGSIISGLNSNDDGFSADSVLYPPLKNRFDDIKTGHLNYFQQNGLYLPAQIINSGKVEKAFAFSLLNNNNTNKNNLVNINLSHSWEKYKSYSLLEFFNLYENRDNELSALKNKYIIIGITDPSIAKSVTSNQESYLPGLGFHAIALDNILNKTYWRESFYTPTIFIFGLILFSIILFGNQSNLVKIYLVSFLLFIICGYIFTNYLYWNVAYSSYIIPIFLLLLTEVYFYVNSSKEQLIEQISESEILKIALTAKEEQLKKLQNQSEQNESPNKVLVDKISILEKQIKALKENNDSAQFSEEIESFVEPKIFEGIVYTSSEIHKIVELIKRIAPQDANILIIGESGTGKEVVAQAIHNQSKNKSERILAINCAALSESLLESELFGHVKGAFTNAVSDKKGMFEAANNGTIFLDEIGETSEVFQVKLLRVIQSGEIQKVGSTETITTNARIIAATNKNLEQLVKEKKFREDLYYRLNVIKIELPPLRERKEDIPILAHHFAKEIKISKGVLTQLEENNWPGNVRELQSVIQRAVIMAKSENRDILQIRDLPKELIKSYKYEVEELILESLREKKFSHSSINETAKELGGLNRIVISENFKGIVFREFVSNNFDINTSAELIASTHERTVLDKVKSKIETYLSNIQKDVLQQENTSFESVRNNLETKFKNLPKKFHPFLDQIIQYYLDKTK